MSAGVPGAILDRLRANLAAAGIRLLDSDLEGMVERGFFRSVVAFEALATEADPGIVPDDLAAREPTRAAPPPLLDVREAAPGGREDGIVSVEQAAPLLRSRDISPLELTESALARIAARDRELNAFQLVLADRARAAAKHAEREIASGHWRGPLHGVPVAIKDLLAMKGTVTTAGSKLLGSNVTDFDAAAVERLEAAGAVIVGKTRMPEFAYSPGSNNAHYGPTRNPWAPDRDAGGSSSGSGAAVADGIVPIATGTDTGGSIRIPAALCGVVGLKPTYGRVSLFGAVPLSWSLDHQGPIARRVRDAAWMLEALAGHDPRDSRTRAGDEFRAEAGIDAGARGLRIGVITHDGSGAPLGTDEGLAAWRAALARLERDGATLVPLAAPELEPLRHAAAAILRVEATAYHTRVLRERPGDLGDFIRQRLLVAFAYGPDAFTRAQQIRAAARKTCEGWFEQVDLVSTPTVPGAAPPLGVPAETRFTQPFNALGWPAISMPSGRDVTGMPLSIQLVARPWADSLVLRAARALEAATDAARPEPAPAGDRASRRRTGATTGPTPNDEGPVTRTGPPIARGG